MRLQIPYAGSGTTQAGGRVTRVTQKQACISSSGAKLTFEPGFQQLLWRVRRDALTSKLSAMTGRPVTRRLEFHPGLSLTSPRSAEILRMLNCVLQCIAGSRSENDRFLLPELEQSLIVSLLTGSDHNYRHFLVAEAAKAAPWQVRRVEEYIAANLDRPFDIRNAVSLTGSSARTIYRAFRKHRDYSPMEFSKLLRLQKAWETLHKPGAAETVTDVALSCGFSDISHFSRDFSKSFGVPPSSLLRSRKA